MPKQACWSTRPPVVTNVTGNLSTLGYSAVKAKLLMCDFCVTRTSASAQITSVLYPETAASVANARHRSRRRHDDEQVVIFVVRNRHINADERFENRRQRVRVTDDEHDVIRMRLDLRDEQSGVCRANLLDRNASLHGQRLCRVLRALELGRENVLHAGVSQHRCEFLRACLTRSGQWRIGLGRHARIRALGMTNDEDQFLRERNLRHELDDCSYRDDDPHPCHARDTLSLMPDPGKPPSEGLARACGRRLLLAWWLEGKTEGNLNLPVGSVVDMCPHSRSDLTEGR